MWNKIVNLFKRKPQQWELQIPFHIDKVTLKKEVARYPDLHLFKSGAKEVTEFSKDYIIVNMGYTDSTRLILTKEDIQTLVSVLENKTEIGFRKPKFLPLNEAI